MSKHKKTQPLRCFTFSLEMVQVAQKAMAVLTQTMARAESQSDNVAFAEETMQQVKSKLDAMRTSVGTMCLVGFDYNEKMVIAAAIQLYLLEPPAASTPSQQERDLRRCQRIMRFALDPGMSQDGERARPDLQENIHIMEENRLKGRKE